VIAADHPERAVVLQDPARLLQPGAGEAVIGGEGVELVPVVGDRVDMAAIGAIEFAAELEIIGGVKRS